MLPIRRATKEPRWVPLPPAFLPAVNGCVSPARCRFSVRRRVRTACARSWCSTRNWWLEEYANEWQMLDAAASDIASDKIVALCNGRMEFGARALGNRSLLALPSKAANKDRINLAIKKRQNYRPFAPAVTAEDAHRYFVLNAGEEYPYMTMLTRVRDEAQALLPAVTHVDGTARVQTVNSRAQSVVPLSAVPPEAADWHAGCAEHKLQRQSSADCLHRSGGYGNVLGNGHRCAVHGQCQSDASRLSGRARHIQTSRAHLTIPIVRAYIHCGTYGFLHLRVHHWKLIGTGFLLTNIRGSTRSGSTRGPIRSRRFWRVARSDQGGSCLSVDRRFFLPNACVVVPEQRGSACGAPSPMGRWVFRVIRRIAKAFSPYRPWTD